MRGIRNRFDTGALPAPFPRAPKSTRCSFGGLQTISGPFWSPKVGPKWISRIQKVGFRSPKTFFRLLFWAMWSFNAKPYHALQQNIARCFETVFAPPSATKKTGTLHPRAATRVGCALGRNASWPAQTNRCVGDGSMPSFKWVSA